jgi:hypothetical protein
MSVISKKIVILVLCMTGLIFSNPLFADVQLTHSPSNEYSIFDFDFMLENFKPNKKEEIDITLFRKIQFDATVLELPSPRHHRYMAKLLRQFGGENPPKVTMGLMVTSVKGESWNLYIQNNLVRQANELLQTGDKVTFYSNHAYNSVFGPGLVVHAFERHPRSHSPVGFLAEVRLLLEKLNKSFSSSFDESVDQEASLEDY